MQHVVRHRPVTEHAHRLAEVYPRHKAYLDAFQAEHGGILAIGTFDDLLVNGSMAIFASRGAAARFVSADPVRERVMADLGAVVAWFGA